MIDTHAHLDFENFDEDREEVIRRAFDNGVKAIINIGVDLATSQKSIELAEKYKNIFAAVGFHPHDAEEILSVPSEGDFAELKRLARHKKVVAIGEIGLDYSRFKDMHQIDKQKELFHRQLKMANELDLPIVIHCREAWEDLYEIVKSKCQNPNVKQNPKPKIKKIPNTEYQILDTKFVLHCYSGDKVDTEEFLKLPNIYFSFSGNITYTKPTDRAEKLAGVVRMIPLDRIMLDSDSPFLAPQAMRGKRNEPANIRFIAQKIADIKGISGEKVERITDLNAIKFFGI